MHDLVQKIIATESEAKILIEEAGTEAEHILSEAQKKGHDVVEKTRQEIINETGRIIDAAINAAEQEKQRCLTNTAAEIENRIQLDPITRQRVVEGVMRCLCRQS